jgi:hypothetical protein
MYARVGANQIQAGKMDEWLALIRDSIVRPPGPALAVLAVIVLAGIVFWVVRRGKRLAAAGLAEAACPACLALAYLAEQPRDLETLTRDQDETGAEQAAKPA